MIKQHEYPSPFVTIHATGDTYKYVHKECGGGRSGTQLGVL